MKKLTSKTAFAILSMHIDYLEKQNDRYRIDQIGVSRLYRMLTTEKEKRIIDDKLENADCKISQRLMNGEITPMMLPEKSRRQSSYIYYLRYLQWVVLPTDPKKADELAYEAYVSMLMNDLIPYKDSLDSFFDDLFAYRRSKYVEEAFKEGHRFTDDALQSINRRK